MNITSIPRPASTHHRHHHSRIIRSSRSRFLFKKNTSEASSIYFARETGKKNPAC
jgi:hypothetical protein